MYYNNDNTNYYYFVGLPSVNSLPRVVDHFLEYDASIVELSCSFSSQVPSEVYWVKNGELLDTSNTYDLTTGTLLLTDEKFENGLFGIYQCFIENEYGTDYTINRILVKGEFVGCEH